MTNVMGISHLRLTLALLAFALVAAACGGGGADVDTTRRPITTTLPPTQVTETTQATTTAVPTTAPTTSAAPEPLPNSIGGAADPNVAAVPAGAERFFYAGNDAATSLRENALGDEQLLYYDVYAPTVAGNGLTALYLHDGGLDAGYANGPDSQDRCRQLSQLGAWCAAIEFRRGYAGFSVTPTGAVEVSAAQAERYRRTFRDARNDALEAWFHLDALAESIGLPPKYLLVGDGSGASIASDIALTTAGLPYEIAGAVLSSGTHEAGRPLAEVPTFPVVIQSGLFDATYPAYLGNVFLDGDMPAVIGAKALYDQLAADGVAARLFLNAQEGHGLGGYRDGDQVSYLPAAVQLFLNAAPSGAVIEYRFSCDDANFGAATPGLTVTTAQIPGFRYEPYESDLESGLSPIEALELHPLETTNCEG